MVNRIPSKSNDTSVKSQSPLIHIDEFLLTATTYFNVSRMQAAGFRAKMQGRFYQTSDSFFKEIESYLSKKIR